MDYPSQQRLKIWAEAEVYDASEKADLANELTPANYKARIERVILFRIRAYDWNCPQHITPRYTLNQIGSEIARLNPEVVKSAFGDLHQAGLINTDKSIFATMTSAQGLQLLGGRVSDLGNRFIHFCMVPK